MQRYLALWYCAGGTSREERESSARSFIFDHTCVVLQIESLLALNLVTIYQAECGLVHMRRLGVSVASLIVVAWCRMPNRNNCKAVSFPEVSRYVCTREIDYMQPVSLYPPLLQCHVTTPLIYGEWLLVGRRRHGIFNWSSMLDMNSLMVYSLLFRGVLFPTQILQDDFTPKTPGIWSNWPAIIA
jgi:hypothetical protein